MTSLYPSSDSFAYRHLGPDAGELDQRLEELGERSLDEFIRSVIPDPIRSARPLAPKAPLKEHEALLAMRALASRNQIFRSLIGLGYHASHTPAVIQRNILENPGWYTQYTPYQAEIAQGRLEALLNFQTMVADLTGFGIANASLLDEATAGAEAMTMFFGIKNRPQDGVFFVSDDCHPQNIGVVRTRAKHLGIRVVVGKFQEFEFSDKVFGALLQYPASDGALHDYRPFCQRAHASGALVVVAADLLSLALLVPPAEFGADAAVGNTQRFGIPLGYGGPHAAYFATKDEFKRHVPGRIIGISIDSTGKRALRMALQTREQHIRREKATSNICTAQVLLAVMAGMYAVYHGPEGLRRIAGRIHQLTQSLASGLKELGFSPIHGEFFDTLHLPGDPRLRQALEPALRANRINLRWYDDSSFGVALDETVDEETVQTILEILARQAGKAVPHRPGEAVRGLGIPGELRRSSPFLTHPVFNSYRSETEMVRYIRSLEEKDLSLTASMIPLGSCTMKLNAASELYPITWEGFGALHPYAPVEQAQGYHELFTALENELKEITGFARISFQPNSGAQGEYTGLLVIRAYHEQRGEGHRNVCLIPASAHGTNPASAVMAGLEVVIVRSREDGSIDVEDLGKKAQDHADRLAALMVTYPSTHGVFEEGIKDICAIVHRYGGQVYMDGANLNAQVGLCRPAELGADVCHLNLHKTFCIPHGGGGPGAGPIGVAQHLAPLLPGHPLAALGAKAGVGPVAAAPWGSASILPISLSYCWMMGSEGLRWATEIAILNANYMAKRLENYYPIVYRGTNGRVAHEFIIDLRALKENAAIEVEDVAKRLMDYGFHAPTTSFPVPGTLMIEPTESESKEELDRYCDALIAIRGEVAEIERGEADRENNVLKNAPHTSKMLIADDWKYPYGRAKAVYPLPWLRLRKFWPSVGRINNVHGDRNLICTCQPIEAYIESGGITK